MNSVHPWLLTRNRAEMIAGASLVPHECAYVFGIDVNARCAYQ